MTATRQAVGTASHVQVICRLLLDRRRTYSVTEGEYCPANPGISGVNRGLTGTVHFDVM